MNEDDNGTTGVNDFEAELEGQARQLRADVQPGRDLWPAIAEAIATPARRASSRWPRLVAQAAAVVLLIGASSSLTWLAMQDNASQPGAPAPGQLLFEPVSGSFGSEYTLGPDFTDARASLVSKLDAELERLPPATRADVEKNIATIRAAIAEINRALAGEPDNVLLQELLLNAYSEELAVMKKVDRLAHSVMRREDI